MTMKKLLTGASAFAFAVSLAGIASAQESVLARVLGDIDAEVTGGSAVGRILNDDTFLGAVEGVLSNVAASVPTIINNTVDTAGDMSVLIDGAVVPITAGTSLILGRIDSSVNLDFLRTGDIISNSSISALANGDNLTTEAFYNLEGTLGAVETTAIGAVLTAADTAITVGAAQDVAESMARDSVAAVASTSSQAVLASNLALNTVDLDAAVNLTVEDYSLAASGIATTAIGAVGGGTITSGNIPQLERAISATVALN